MKNIPEISLLIDFYGNLLTDKKILYLDDYYFKDLSLIEIAQKYSVSKNAIFDSINNSVIELNKYEEKLNFIKKYKMRINIYNKLNNDILKNELLATEVYNNFKK
ncbi:MAG: hypothetical protein RSA40_01240 [Malacoplasma sp.]